MSVLSLIFAIATIALPGVALAHAHLVRSLPAAGAHIPHSPQNIQLWFSEAPEATLTRMVITGAQGKEFSVASVRADPSNALLLVADVGETLGPGSYTLEWRTVAKDDGHPSNGSFNFVVDGNRDSAAALVGASEKIRNIASAQSVEPHEPQSMGLEAPTFVLVRWLDLAAIICVVGVVAFRLLVIPGVRSRGSSGVADSFAALAIPRASSLGILASGAAVLGFACRLYAERAAVGIDVGLGTILHTFWGHLWIAQMTIALVACIVFAIARFGPHAIVMPAWIAAAVIAVLIGATRAFSGHAMAATQYRSFSVILDAIHVIAAGAWVGGLVALVVVGVPAALLANAEAGDPTTQRSVSIVATVVNAFSPVALVSAGFVVLSGVIAAYLRIGSFGRLFHTSYGTVLLVKLCFVLLLLAGGAFNWLRMRDALSHRDAEHAVIRTFERSAWLELGAAVLVIAATAVLIAAQPPVR